MNRLFEAVANDEALSAKWEELGLTRRKMIEYMGLFFVLLVIYSICLPSYLKFLDAAPARLGLGGFMSPLVKFCLVSVLPFGVLAYSDKTWRSSDAASVICGAWGVVYMGLSVQYKELCPMGLLIALIPFILTAQLAHIVGHFCQRAKRVHVVLNR